MDDFTLSVLIPVYNEEKTIYSNIMRIKKTLDTHAYKHSFIVVDDGSRDGTWEEIMRLAGDIPAIQGIRLSRNFGKESALCAGLDMVEADAVVIMDADLQHPPETIPFMVALWRNGDADVVDGVKETRGKESLFSKFTASIFYRILSRFSGINLKNASDFKLLDVKVVKAWRKLPERSTFFRAMSYWVGFKRKEVLFQVSRRTEGKSKWSFFSLLKLAVTAITSFSAIPLQIVTFLGFLFLAGSFILGIQTMYMKITGAAVSGFTTVILLLLILGSCLMIGLGIIGVYISRIFDEVKHRPRYIIADYLTGLPSEE